MKFSKSGEEFRKTILSEYYFTDAQLEILDAALAARDLWLKAQRTVDRDGLTVTGDRGGVKAHPLLAVIRDSRAQFLAGFKMLGLHADDDVPRRGPGAPTSYEKTQKRLNNG